MVVYGGVGLLIACVLVCWWVVGHFMLTFFWGWVWIGIVGDVGWCIWLCGWLLRLRVLLTCLDSVMVWWFAGRLWFPGGVGLVGGARCGGFAASSRFGVF